MVEHCLQASVDVTTYFVDPHCTLADELRHHHGAGISAAPELRELLVGGISDPWRRPSTELAPRLVEALSALSENSVPLLAVAAQVGLSAQRLRALARRDLGMPLTRWRVWTRLRRAAQAVQAGQSLADAAVTAGFSDQAHLTRQMREMMGLTPATVLPLLRHHFLDAT
ncbi:DNA-binding transcriptional regulator AraC [Mycobacterium marinum]|nr:DNA-binding transcriptional regulator AraC [Mycobacterium marinum]